MRAHVKRPEPIALIHGLTAQDFSTVENILREQEAQVLEVGCDRLHWQVGTLAGFAGFQPPQPAENVPLASAVLLFSGFSGKAVDRALDALRTTGVKIPLKAVVTATNQSWSFSALAEELDKERAAIMARKSVDNPE